MWLNTLKLVDFRSDRALSWGVVATGCWSRRRYHRMWCY